MQASASAAAERGQCDQAHTLYERLVKFQPKTGLWKERIEQLRPGVFAVWNFDNGPGSWAGENHCKLSGKDGVLTVRTTGYDPSFRTAVTGPAGGTAIVLRYRTDLAFPMQVFWGDASGGIDESRRADYLMPASARASAGNDASLLVQGQSERAALHPHTASEHPLEIDSIVLRHLEPAEAWREARGYAARKAVIDDILPHGELLTPLVKLHPDEPQLQLALARYFADRGDVPQANAARAKARPLFESKAREGTRGLRLGRGTARLAAPANRQLDGTVARRDEVRKGLPARIAE